MKNLLKLFFVFMLVTSCTEDDALMETKNTNTNYKTAEVQKVSALLEDTQKSSTWFIPHLSYSESIALNHTDAEITAYPVTSVLTNAYSRLFSLEVDGETRLAIYHMLPSEASTSEHFYGNILISNLEGKILKSFEVEANEFKTLIHIDQHSQEFFIQEFNQEKSSCPDCNYASCDLCEGMEELPEVIVIANPDVPEVMPPGGGGGNYSPPSSPLPIEDPEDPLPDLPGGDGANNDSCPPGMIKDNSGNCIEPPEDEEVECPVGYVENKDGSCVEVPCDKDPVKNPKIAKQNLSGIEGGSFGCTRIGSGCGGQPNKKMHGGLDVLNPFGAPIFAMYDGVASPSPNELSRAGWVTVLIANVDGVSTKIQYFHLQQDNRANGTIKAGDIIGYQGDSGNLRGAIADGDVESHTHIKTENDQGLQNPEDYIGNLTTEDGSITISNPDCN
ncbi:M23 family metallopeptidase [Psychroflexus montanilacus]|uniref:M23 family metallopeptidase n=1 Tax=Psychroflexus montanilacus TaxID=2873598 RepID=UPI001CCCFE36|nr:M23 family metallopeptidase [Psychroflexus montanilacus]MBZ9652198.1 M23 family metallopeptidase [Psychroflexus montanilacus]